MNIVILNGSPKGKHSITLQYLVYLEKKFSEHTFQILNVSLKIKKIEKDENYFDEILQQIKRSDLVIWSFGLWVLAVPAIPALHCVFLRQIEAIVRQ